MKQQLVKNQETQVQSGVVTMQTSEKVSEEKPKKRKLESSDQGWHEKPLENIDSLSYLSASKCKLLLESQKKFHRRYNLGIKEEDTPAKIFGRVVHKALLEPEKFLKQVVVQPEFSGNGSQLAKKKWLCGLPPDAIVLKEEDLEKIKEMIQSLTKHPVASKILNLGKPEQAGYWYDERLDQWFMMIADWVRPRLLVDLKTTRSAHPKKFAADCFNMNYLVQAAIYCDGATKLTGEKLDLFAIMAVENNGAFITEVYTIPEYVLEMGRTLRDNAVRTFKELKENLEKQKDYYVPGYRKTCEPIDLTMPNWAHYELEQVEESHVG